MAGSPAYSRNRRRRPATATSRRKPILGVRTGGPRRPSSAVSRADHPYGRAETAYSPPRRKKRGNAYESNQVIVDVEGLQEKLVRLKQDKARIVEEEKRGLAKRKWLEAELRRSDKQLEEALSAVGGNQFAPMVQTVAELRRLRTRLQKTEEELLQKNERMAEMEKVRSAPLAHAPTHPRCIRAHALTSKHPPHRPARLLTHIFAHPRTHASGACLHLRRVRVQGQKYTRVMELELVAEEYYSEILRLRAAVACGDMQRLALRPHSSRIPNCLRPSKPRRCSTRRRRPRRRSRPPTVS